MALDAALSIPKVWTQCPNSHTANVAKRFQNYCCLRFQMTTNLFQGIDDNYKCITKWADMDTTIFN